MINDINKINKTIEKLKTLDFSKKDIDKAVKKVDDMLKEEDKIFEEIFKKIKNAAANYPDMDDFIDAYLDAPELEFEFLNDIEYIEPINNSLKEHRWYTLQDNIYRIKINQNVYYFGATEVISLKSESMSYDDTGWGVKIFKVVPIEKIVFERA